MKRSQLRIIASLVGMLLLVSVIAPAFTQGPGVPPPPKGHDPAFNATAAEEESYWYSRYDLGALTMQSGHGVMADVLMEMVMGAMGMVDADPNDGDTVVVLANVALLKIVYAGGDPHLTTMMDPTDFATLRWVGGDESLFWKRQPGPSSKRRSGPDSSTSMSILAHLTVTSARNSVWWACSWR